MKIKIIAGIVVLIGATVVATQVLGANVTSSVTVGNSAPTVTGITINGGNTITLTPNTTTSVSVFATVTDNNGCADITNGTVTIMIYRNGLTSSTCFSTADNQNCYRATVFNTTSSCSTTNTNTTTTFGVFYFANATDASSSLGFSGQGWRATMRFTDQNGATSTADSPTTTLSTLNAINVTTASINYGTLGANTNTGATNTTTTITNAGNSSTSLQLSASQTLTSGSNVIATSSQVYSTSSFTYPGTSTALTGSAVQVNAFALVTPTTTTNVASNIFWGLNVPNGTPTGTYTGTNVFSALFLP